MKILLMPILVSCMALTSGCVGTTHGYRCYQADGRYFRATRMNYDVLVGRETVNESVTVRNGIETVHPGWSFPVRLPFVAIDFPFGLVLDTVLIPFIACGVVNAPAPHVLTPEDFPMELREEQRDAQPAGGAYVSPATGETSAHP